MAAIFAGQPREPGIDCRTAPVADRSGAPGPDAGERSSVSGVISRLIHKDLGSSRACRVP